MKDVRHEGQIYSVGNDGAFHIVDLLKACARRKDLGQGSRLHEYIREHKILEKNCYVASSLVGMYARCGALAKAQQVLKELPICNEVTWTGLITAYAKQGQGEEALKCFDSMQQEGHSPDEVTFISALKACGITGATAKGEQIHEMIVNLGMLEKNVVLGNTLVDMYARCGALTKAQQVLNELPIRDAITWTSLIAGYVQQQQGKEALKCFDCMLDEGHLPDAVTFVCALKACGSVGATTKGEQIHDKIVSLGMLAKNVVLGNALVDMYVRCKQLPKAQQVLNELPVRNVVTWTALIAGYTQQGQGDEALKCLESMQREGHSPDGVTFMCSLKACGSMGAVSKGEQIHDNLVRLGMLEKDITLGNTLVDMYAKCGVLTKALQVLNELPVRNIVTWNTLLAGYIQHEQGEEALKCFDRMQFEGQFPDEVTLIHALKACVISGVLAEGERIHETIVSLGMLKKNFVLGGTLVAMYAKCGALARAQQVFNELPVRDAVAWTALITGYTQQGQGDEALTCFYNMQREGHFPDAITFICALKACGNTGAASEGEEIHEKIVSLGMLENDIVLGHTLVEMYAKCGALAKAQKVLDELPVRDVVMWTTLIAGYAQQGQGEEALKCFDRMQHEGHSPDVVTFMCAVKACGSIGAAAKGEEIHDKIVSLGILKKDAMLGTILVDMYVKCGVLAKAQQVLNELPIRDVVTWTALMAGYAQQGQGKEALECFDNMQCEGHSPSVITFICALKACGSIGAVTKGEQIHESIVRLGMLEKDIVLGNTLVDMYARCGAVVKAQKVFDKLSLHNAVTWNALIQGYAQHGQGEEALKCFDAMQELEGHSPDVITFICALKACGSIGVANKGEQIHEKVASLGMLEKDVVLGSTLVDMYVKCGVLDKAAKVFEELSTQTVVTWNALIGGYAQGGQSGESLSSFERMLLKGVSPDSTSWVSMLNACIHSGLLDAGKMYFLRMTGNYGIIPNGDHYCCMVDLYSRAGNFHEALAVIEKMPSADDLLVWNALLGASQKWGEMKLGRLAFEHACCLDGRDAGTYVSMVNIYTVIDIQEDADKI